MEQLSKPPPVQPDVQDIKTTTTTKKGKKGKDSSPSGRKSPKDKRKSKGAGQDSKTEVAPVEETQVVFGDALQNRLWRHKYDCFKGDYDVPAWHSRAWVLIDAIWLVLRLFRSCDVTMWWFIESARVLRLSVLLIGKLDL